MDGGNESQALVPTGKGGDEVSEIKQYNPQISVQATMTLNESEMAALDAIAGYGADNFLAFFYEHLGTSYLEPHEAGLRSLFKEARNVIPGILNRRDAARKAFMEIGVDK